jgi:hypothetical protein
MSVQRLHAFEKTSIQARHTIKRLEAVIENPRSSEFEKEVAQRLWEKFKDIRYLIPNEYKDVDLTRE